MGNVGLEWAEIISWANEMYSVDAIEYVDEGCGVFVPVHTKQCLLSPWELQTIKFISDTYSGECATATDKDKISPMEEAEAIDEAEIDRGAIQNRLKNKLSGFKKSNQIDRSYTTEAA